MEPVKIWEWMNAPEHYKRCSNHGGDEDYVIVAPHKIDNFSAERIVERLTICDYCKCTIVEEGKLIDVYITAHA